MRLHPNPPRMVTVVAAVVLALIGVTLAWPIEPALGLLAPLTDTVSSFGLAMDQTTGFLCLLVSSGLLVAGSLLPGIQDMRKRTNFAPTARTIIVALALMVVGLLGATGTILPAQAGVIAFVAAIALLLVGMVVPQI